MAYTTAQLVTLYTNANLGKAPDAATTLTLDAMATQTQTGGITDATALSNTLKLLNGTTAVAVETYQFFTGHAPSAAGLDYLVDSTTNTNDLNDAYYSKFAQENRFINFSINLATGAGEGAAAFAASYGSVDYATVVATAYDKIIGNAAATAAGVNVGAAVAFLSRADNITYLTAFVRANTTLTSDADVSLAVKAALIGEILSAATTSGIGGYASSTNKLLVDLSDGTLSTDNAAGINLFTAYPSAPVVGTTFLLTTGADTLTGTSANDTFNAAEAAGPVATWTTGDTIDGGAGADVFNVTQTAAIATPLSAQLLNVETANFTSGTTGSVINSANWTGLTNLNVTAPGAVTVTSGTATAITVTDAAQAGLAIAVNGGSTVNVAATSAVTGGTINVGATTAASGVTTVNATTAVADVAGATATVGAAVTVRGGTSIVVNNVFTGTLSDNAGDTVTGGVVTVTGDANTTAVTVNQSNTATQSLTANGGAGRAQVIDGQVVIKDANSASATAAGTLASVTLKSWGAGSTVDSSALTTLNLSGTGGTLTVTKGSLTATAVTTQAVNVNGMTAGTVTLGNEITTLNVTGSTAASTFTGLTAAGVTALNIAGDAKVSMTQTLGALTSVTVTNTAGAVLSTAIGTGVTFSGGAGADAVTLTTGFTKAITMGDGNDTVTYAGPAGTGGSVNAGNGTDTIAMTGAQAAAASLDAVFNTKFAGFEVLSVAASGANTINLAGINNVSSVTTLGATGALQFDNMASGGVFTLTGAVGAGSYIVNVDNAPFNGADSLNVSLSNSTAATVAFGSITATGVETVNISTVDAGTVANTVATIDSLTLVDTAATSIVVSGNNGLILTNTGNVAVTSFNASGVVGNAAEDTSALLGVTYTSANTTAAAAVTITGGAGNDTLTGSVSVDTITGGAGSDTINGGGNADVINLGAGHDVVVVVNNLDATAPIPLGSTTASFDVVNGFNLVSTAIAAGALATDANFVASTLGGANVSLLSLDARVDDAGAGAGTVSNMAVEADGTGTGQAAGVTYDVTNGILTLGGAGAGTVDTLGEWLTEAAAVAATTGDTLAFHFGSDTYVFGQNGAADVFIQLVGVNATSLVEATGATNASAGAILFHG